MLIIINVVYMRVHVLEETTVVTSKYNVCFIAAILHQSVYQPPGTTGE